jgi:hypothetical protein
MHTGTGHNIDQLRLHNNTQLQTPRLNKGSEDDIFLTVAPGVYTPTFNIHSILSIVKVDLWRFGLD